MAKELLGAVSALALLAGVAAAQDAPATGTAPGAAPAVPGAAAPPAGTAAAPADAAPAGMPPTEQAVAPEPAAPAATPAPAPVETAAPAPATPAAEPPAAAPTPATEQAAAGEPVSADDMMGRQVEGSDGQALGRVKDVIVDSASGRIQRLVVASGGFLGLGAKDVAVDFADVEVRPEGGIVAKNLTQESIEGLPEFDVSVETKSLDEPPPVAAPATTTTGGIATPGTGSTGGGAAPAQ